MLMQLSRLRKIGGRIKRQLSYRINNTWERWRDNGWHSSNPNPVLTEALGQSLSVPSDIRDHVGTIFYEALSSRPQLVVELGTRGGVSTRALLAAAEFANAHVLSIDIDDCSNIDLPDRFRRRWTFVRSDDVAFAGEPFSAFCAARKLPPMVEVILIDTSHLFEHTRDELKSWLPRLGPRGVIILHDTNMGSGRYRRLDREIGFGWDNKRGVIRAIEEMLGRRYDEQTFFTDVAAGFVITHQPWSNGLLIMRKFER
jgi:predicted O-methyltransferase YrrM